MKKYLQRLIVTLLFILVSGMLFTGCGLRYVVGTNYINKADAKEFKVEKAVVDPITSIEVHTGTSEVELIESDNYYVEIDYLYWEEEPEYTVKDGRLYFDDSNAFPNSYSINFNLHNTIRIYLPEAAALKDLSIQNASGDVSIAGFVANDVEVTVSYGDFTMKNAAASDADITLSSGTSKISDVQIGKLDFTNSYGNATFTNINTGDSKLPEGVAYDRLDLTMSSGDVDINNLQVGSIDINNSYGDITCKEVIAEEFTADLDSGNFDLSKADLRVLDINNSYGDITLDLLGPEEDYSMDLRTSYGKIKVGNSNYDENYSKDSNGARSLNADLSSGDIIVTFK